MFNSTIDKQLKRAFTGALLLAGIGLLVFYFGRHPRVMDVGYRPQQPVPFDHSVHSGNLKIACVYCHTSVEKSAHSTVPPTSTCMNCHTEVKRDSPKLKRVLESYEKNIALGWIRVHRLPDYAFFNHSRHINVGIDCASCHGEVETLGVIVQKKPLTMGWCLDCHRNPEKYSIRTRPITGVDVRPEVLATALKKGPQNCSACHH